MNLVFAPVRRLNAVEIAKQCRNISSLSVEKRRAPLFTTTAKHIIIGFFDSTTVAKTRDWSGQWQQPDNYLPYQASC